MKEKHLDVLAKLGVLVGIMYLFWVFETIMIITRNGHSHSHVIPGDKNNTTELGTIEEKEMGNLDLGS